MWPWIAVLVFVIVTLWHSKFRTRSSYDRRPAYSSRVTVTEDVREVDYVVVGAGPGGLAACQRLLTASDGLCTVLLVEAGNDLAASSTVEEVCQVTLSKQRLLCFAPECVAGAAVGPTAPVGVDEGKVVRRPLRVSAGEASPHTAPTQATEDEQVARQRSERERALLYTPYPRGRGVGGCSLLDWGLILGNLAPCDGRTAPGPLSVLNLPSFTDPTVLFPNPLSWAFKDAVKAIQQTHGVHSSNTPWSVGGVFRSPLRVDSNGRRLPLASALLSTLSRSQLQRLTVLTGFKVVRVVSEQTSPDSPTAVATAVVLRDARCPCGNAGSTDTATVHVRKGVVLAAGALQSPRLLYDSLHLSPLAIHRGMWASVGSTTASVRVRDCVALPFISKVHMRISADRVNLCDVKNSVMYWFAQRGAYLTPFTDCVASFPLKQLGPRAELLVMLLPFGGRDPALFSRLGWDRILGSFHEGMTMLLVINGVPDLSFALPLNAADARGEEMQSGEGMSGHPRCVGQGTPVNLRPEVTQGIHEGLRLGLRVCRKLVTTGPLSYLTPGTEAVDATLLTQDPHKAFRLAKLTHTPAKHLSMTSRRELAELSAWALSVCKTPEYEKAYIEHHTYWLGFASGSSAPFLHRTWHVKGVDNLVVGDASANGGAGETPANTLFAGSVDAAMQAGAAAVDALLAAI